jgi:hypothetical protein
MAKHTVADFSLIRTLLVGTTALALVASPAWAKIGVTSATDGDPLGKPPAENERILRIGIDVQTDELITTKNNDRAHLVFLDGTSITVGPNAQVKLDKFVYDPGTKKGEMALTATKGVLRLVGGKISKSNAITIATPSSTIGIRGGITILSVSQSQTVSTFVFGNSLTVTGAGATQTITRPGSQVVTNFGGTPGNPTPVPPGGLNGSLGALEGNPNQGGTPGGGNPDQQAQNSGFSSQNSGQQPPLPPPTTTSTTTTTQTTNAVNNGNSSTNPNPVTTTTTTKTDATTTTRIYTFGRYLQEKAYIPETFDRNTLSADRNPNNNQALNQTGSTSHTDTTTTVTTTTTVDNTVTNQTSTSTTVQGPTLATITAPGGSGVGTSNSGGGDSGGSTLTVPWMPGQIFQFQVTTSLGPANGLGLVAATQDFFAYTFVVASGANAGQKFLFFGGTPTTKAEFPKVGIGAQTLTNLGNPGALPFAPDTVGGDAALQASAASSPLYSVYTPNLNSPHGNKSVPSALQVTISIAGSSTTQKSYMGVFIANYGTDSATRTVYSAGTFMDSYRLGANQHIGRGISYQATADTGSGSAIYGDTGQYQVYVPDKVVTTRSRHGDESAVHHGRHHRNTTTRTPGAALDQAAANQLPTSYYPVTMATPVADASTLPQDLGQTRATQTMTGYAAGLVEKRTGNTFTTVVPTLNILNPSTNISISTDAQTNQAMAKIVLSGLDGTLQLGGQSGANGPTSAFIDNSRYAMITQTNDPHRQSTIGGSTPLSNNTMLASYQTAPVVLPPSSPTSGPVQPCTCEYLTWGFWSSNMNLGNNQTANVNLGTYVAGQVTANMPLTGGATFNGMMVGNVQHGSNAYVGTGTYMMDWSFQRRAGTFSGTFDGTSYSSLRNGIVGVGGASFSGAFGNLGSLRVGGLSGSFFGPNAQNQGGQFAIAGPHYLASGIFAGQR